jgi:hypothetical protein
VEELASKWTITSCGGARRNPRSQPAFARDGISELFGWGAYTGVELNQVGVNPFGFPSNFPCLIIDCRVACQKKYFKPVLAFEFMPQGDKAFEQSLVRDERVRPVNGRKKRSLSPTSREGRTTCAFRN